MPVYTVSAVSDQTRPWGTDMIGYRVTLKAADGTEMPNVDLSRKAGQPAPTVGESVDGTIDTSGNYGPKFKANRPAGGGGGRGRDPQERAEIRRQNAQAQALRYMEIKQNLRVANGLDPENFKPSDLTPLIQFFFDDTGSVKA